MFDSRPNHHNTMASHAAVLEHPSILPVSCILQGSCTAVAVFLLHSVFCCLTLVLLPLLNKLYTVVTQGKEKERKLKSLLRAAVSGESVLLFYVLLLFFFQRCRLPGERKTVKVRTDPFAQDQQLRARACLVFAYLKCPTALVRTSERMM